MTRKQIQGYRNNLKGAVNACDNGATVELDLTTAQKLVEVIDSLRAEVARRTAEGLTMARNLTFLEGDLHKAESRVTAAEADADRLAEALTHMVAQFPHPDQLADQALAAHTQRVNA